MGGHTVNSLIGMRFASQFWAFKQHWYRKECLMSAPALAKLLGCQC